MTRDFYWSGLMSSMNIDDPGSITFSYHEGVFGQSGM